MPRTEADGAFNYSRTSNRRGLLNSGMLDSKPSIISHSQLYLSPVWMLGCSLLCVAPFQAEGMPNDSHMAKRYVKTTFYIN